MTKKAWQYRMHALVHTVCSVVVVPYVALALFFLFVGQVAGAKGLMELFDIVLKDADWFFGWGIYLTPALWVFLVAMGFVPSLQSASSLCLCLLSVSSLLVVVTLHSTRLELGQIIFLLPCVAVAATSAWLFYRAGALGLAGPIGS